MKTFNLKLVGLLAVVALSILGYTQKNRSEELDDLLLKNIEALASGEEQLRGMCFGSGSIVCPRIQETVEHVYLYY